MLDRLRAFLALWLRRLRRIERRETAEFRRWLEQTDNLIHLSALLFVPALVALVTTLSNSFAQFSFLLFPPLASGTYTLFANPEGKYANPVRFVVGLTAGASCGWVALQVETFLFGPSAVAVVSPGSAAVSILLVGLLTWAFDIEEPSAFSSALLVLAASTPWRYVGFILLASSLIAGVFTLWRRTVYQERASLLYGTMRADDHVLVPLRGERALETALFGARIAEAHEAGKVVLLDVVEDEKVASAERTMLERTRGIYGTEAIEKQERVDPETREEALAAVERVESTARRVRTEAGVPVEVVVATGSAENIVGEVAHRANCDLIVTPYEAEFGVTSTLVRAVFKTDTDAIAFRSIEPREEWRRVLVLVSRPGDTAHAMLDFATRLAGKSGTVSVCTCIDREVERRPAEDKLGKVVDAVDGPIETRVARANVLEFVERNADSYDLVMLGASRDRSAASRLVAPPTFERLRDLASDVAVVDRGKVK
jgi:nucleotide-binding universal stress UspA family protein